MRLATIPSWPSPSTSANHRSATSSSSLHGVRRVSGPAGNSVERPGHPLDADARREGLESDAPLRQRALSQVLPSFLEQKIEQDQRRRNLGRELTHTGLGRVQPQLELLEHPEPSVAHEHQLAVGDERPGMHALEHLDDLGEEANHRTVVAAEELDPAPASIVTRHRKPSHFGS